MTEVSTNLDTDWDQLEPTKTAWSELKKPRRRRVYGRSAAERREKEKATAARRRLASGAPGAKVSSKLSMEKDGTSCLPSSKTGLQDEVSSPPINVPARPPRLVHTRSHSVSTLPSDKSVQRPQRHSRSQSVVMKPSFRSQPENEFDFENVHPNLVSSPGPTTPECPSSPPYKLEMELQGKNLKGRPRKTRKLSDFAPLVSSFSQIANSGDSTWSIVPPPQGTLTQPVSPPVDVTDLMDTRSVGNSVSSSRKRGALGVCDDLDEWSTENRSRSRFLSPNSRTFSASSGDNPFLLEGDEDDGDDNFIEENHNRRGSSFDTEEEDDDLSDNHGGSFEIIDQSIDSVELCNVSVPMLRRTSSLKLEKDIFEGATSHSGRLSNDIIIETMSSFDDLCFLIQAMRKEKKSTTLAFFGPRKNWTVAPSAAWTPSHRVAFLQWSTRQLGFTVRAGGGSVAFLQLARPKGERLLTTLESAYKYYKETIDRPKGQSPMQSVIKSSKAPPESSSPLFDSVGPSTRKESFLGLGRHSEQSQTVDIKLLHTLQNLSLSSETIEHAPPMQHHVKEEESIQIDTILEGSMSSLDDFHLSRKPPRPSNEHHVDGQDLVSHLHGLSPVANARRPRLSGFSSIVPSPTLYPPSSTRSKSGSRLSFGAECVGMETPQVKQGPMIWEGRSGGKDWGAHAGCPSVITNKMLEDFENRHKAEMQYSSEQVVYSQPQFDGTEDLRAAPPRLTHDEILDEDKEADVEEDEEEEDVQSEFDSVSLIGHHTFTRQSSLGVSALRALNLGDPLTYNDDKAIGMSKRRQQSIAMYHRLSLVTDVTEAFKSGRHNRHSSFAGSVKVTRNHRLSERLANFPSLSDGLSCGTSVASPLSNWQVINIIFSFLNSSELMSTTSLVSSLWADASTDAYSNLMLASLGVNVSEDSNHRNDDLDEETYQTCMTNPAMRSMEKTWATLHDTFPWACYLSDGAFKRVYRVWNSRCQAYEALSVMDVNKTEEIGSLQSVGNEVRVSLMMGSLVRRNVCPNFVAVREMFICDHEPPSSHWGNAENKYPKGRQFNRRAKKCRRPKRPGPDKAGKFQYIRMELCNKGDAEDYLKTLPDTMASPEVSRMMLFQMAFSLYAAADKFSLKHYDVKLLNFFVQSVPEEEDVVLRYGLGSVVFSLGMSAESVPLVKLADFGTACTSPEMTGQPVTIVHLTTLENTPPDFMILGDAALQGHGHDAFGLGLCMLHLFTGDRPYEEILESVECPPALKSKLKRIYEGSCMGYDVIRTVILSDVVVDEDDNIIEGEPDEIFAHTLYRFLVLFGIPSDKFEQKECPKVWKAITSCLEGAKVRKGKGRGGEKRPGPDADRYAKDKELFSLATGRHPLITRARTRLLSMEGGMDLLLSLTNFNPAKRATMSDVLNSRFMATLREDPNNAIQSSTTVMSFMSYATR